MRVIEFWDEEIERIEKNTVSDGVALSEDKLDVFSHLIWNDVKLIDYKVGWFGKTERCTSGYEILKWIIEHAEP